MARESIGQIICECGHVAEIRRRANGQKLAFKVCKHCGVQQGKEPLRIKWLETMGQFGVYGEKPTEVTKPEVKSNIKPVEVKTADWIAPDELKPETLEPDEPAAEPIKSGGTLKPKGSNAWLLKLGLVVGTAALAIYGVKINQTQ